MVGLPFSYVFGVLYEGGLGVIWWGSNVANAVALFVQVFFLCKIDWREVCEERVKEERMHLVKYQEKEKEKPEQEEQEQEDNKSRKHKNKNKSKSKISPKTSPKSMEKIELQSLIGKADDADGDGAVE